MKSRQPDDKHLSLGTPFHVDLGSLCSPAECSSLDSPFVEVEASLARFSVGRQELIPSARFLAKLPLAHQPLGGTIKAKWSKANICLPRRFCLGSQELRGCSDSSSSRTSSGQSTMGVLSTGYKIQVPQWQHEKLDIDELPGGLRATVVRVRQVDSGNVTGSGSSSGLARKAKR